MDALEEPAQILGVHPGRNPMPQVRDPRLRRPRALEPLAHPLHLALDRLAAAVEHVRVEVALERGLARDGGARVRGVDAPVDADHVVAGAVGERGELRVRALGEERHRHGGHACGGELGAHAGGDAPQRRERELFEVVRGELARPRVEHLHELRMREG